MRYIVIFSLYILLTSVLFAGVTAKYSLIGSTRQAVIDVLGKPRSVQLLANIPDSGVLMYDNGSVEIDRNIVVNWSHLNLGRIGITGAQQSFTRHSTPDEVIAVIGFPPAAKRVTQADSTGKGETELWDYANAALKFKDGQLIGWTDFSHSFPLLTSHLAGLPAPKLGGSAAELDAALGTPAALIPSPHDISSLWIYQNTAYFLQGEIIDDVATPRLQAYLSANSKTPAALEKVTQWLVQQPYLDYHKPVSSDKELFAAYVKQNGPALRAKYYVAPKTTSPSYTPPTSTRVRNPIGPRRPTVTQQQTQKKIQQAQIDKANADYQKALQDAFNKYLSADFIAIPKIVKTSTTADVKAKLEKQGLTVVVQPQKMGSPAGTLYATFPNPGWHVKPKSTVTLYVTQ